MKAKLATPYDKSVSFTIFRPNVPEPVPVFAVTVHVVPEPVTVVIDGPDKPVFTRLKFDDVSPVIEASNETSQLSVVALVELLPDRVIEET